MKTSYLLLAGSFAVFAGCSTIDTANPNRPETVLVTYHVKVGKEAEFKGVLSQAWEVYRRDRLVFPEPHIVVQDTEEDGKPRFVEVLTWVSRSIPEHAPESVKTIWAREESLCERRAGHYGIEPGEVQLVVPSRN